MKEKKKIENSKLGLMVLAGILFLVYTLYMIGKNQNIFGSSITIISVVENVNGLVPGNNVRFQGIDVGTVKTIEMDNDSSINITLYIQKKMQPFIRKNAMTSINTDGLMGNKILHILPQEGNADPVEEGDILYSQKAIDTEGMLKKLSSTGDFLEITMINLAEVSEKLNKSESLWALLSDDQLPSDIKNTIREFRIAGSNASALAKAGKEFMMDLEQGKGIVQQVFKDSIMADNLNESIENILKTSADAASMMAETRKMLESIQSGQGTAGLIISDNLMRETLMKSMINIEQSTYNFNENMEALKGSFLFRKYYKNQEKELRKAEKKAKND
ncbi:MlaD family protein [Aquiflexum sp. TKW24L]|uniref:MlaD family protein n=1 Tax=Aquiflexum sp. TKW24L TaxID=2942212 RepID=UPI0020C0C7BF|nr:MlaD family protein [Aquiflexum sp. TKW24L]MCL6258714.1 MlaD family protein [Aquiflexum sp. TKW24L]